MNLPSVLLPLMGLFLWAELPVVVNGRPQLQLGEIWLGNAPPDAGIVVPPKDGSAPTGGISFISAEKPKFTGLIQLQVFVGQGDTDEMTKIHESNSSFVIPEGEDSSSRSGNKCPEGELLNEPDGKCYRSGTVTVGIESPCADDFMRFIQPIDKPGYGECTCVRFRGTTTRPVVFWEKTDRCYWIYDQGPCEKGEWLAFGNASDYSELQCVKRSCPENSAEDTNTLYPNFWFEHKGKCLKTETKNPEFCKDDKLQIFFAVEKPEPVCLAKRPNIHGIKTINVTGAVGCKSGYKPLPTGDCKRKASFDRR